MDRKPARKITNHGREVVTGGFASFKNNRTVKWESQIERDLLYLLEFDDSIQSYFSQAVRISYTFQGKLHHHYPDIEVTRKDGSIDYYEVKPFDKTQNDEFKAKSKIIADRLAKQGHGYRVITEREIRVDPKFNNYKILYRYLPVNVALADEKKILELIMPSKQIFEARDLLEAEGYDLTYCYALMAQGKIKFDINQPIDFYLHIYGAN